MSDRIIIKADGLKKSIRQVQRLGVEVSDIKAAFKKIGEVGVAVEKEFAPERTGLLKSTIRSTNAKNYAAVLTGGARRAPYARAVNYGTKKIKAQFYGQKMANKVAPRALSILQGEIDRLIRKV